MKTIPKSADKGIASVSEICSCFDLKRDAYYKYLKRSKKRELRDCKGSRSGQRRT